MCEATWRDLCEAIIDEKDPDRLFALADQLQEVLDRDGLTAEVHDRSEN